MELGRVFKFLHNCILGTGITLVAASSKEQAVEFLKNYITFGGKIKYSINTQDSDKYVIYTDTCEELVGAIVEPDEFPKRIGEWTIGK